MGQRLVLKTDGKLTLQEIKKFVTTAEQYGCPLSDEVDVAKEGDELTFIKSLPLRVRTLNGKKVVIRQKNKKEKAVAKQIKEHQEKPTENKEGYVPPEGRKKAAPVQKVKCPVCNIRKNVVTIGSVKSLKPHLSKGETCPGGGAQVIMQGKKAAYAVAKS